MTWTWRGKNNNINLMKRLLVYLFLVLGLILINQKIEASQSNELKLKKIKLNTKDQEFYKIGSDIRGRVEGLEWINRFYGYTEDNKLKGLIEIFTFDNSGGHGDLRVTLIDGSEVLLFKIILRVDVKI